MARAVPTRTKVNGTIAAWIVALLIFFPISYTLTTRCGPSRRRSAASPHSCPRSPSRALGGESHRGNYIRPFTNRCSAVGSTVLGLIVGIPRHGRWPSRLTKRTKDVLMWILSIKRCRRRRCAGTDLLLFIWMGLLDTHLGITVVLMLINLPIIIWMLNTGFREIPGEILEAARMDRKASLWERDLARPPHADGGAGTSPRRCLNTSSPGTGPSGRSSWTTTNAAPLTRPSSRPAPPPGPVLG